MAVVEPGRIELLLAGFEVLLFPQEHRPHALGSAVAPSCPEKLGGVAAYFYDIPFPVSSIRGVLN